MVKELWVDKYKPKTINDYVFRDEKLKGQVEEFIRHKSIPNLLLHGAAGIGKSSLIKVIFNEIQIDPGDILYLNASSQKSRGIEAIQTQVEGFASTIPNGDFKVILLEEADALTPMAQPALRRPMEDYSEWCRFVLTANYPHKLIQAIRSRCQEIVFQNMDPEAFKMRMAEILVYENINGVTEDILDTYMQATYPDLRKCINVMQQNVFNGELLIPSASESFSKEWQLECIELFKKNDITSARKVITSNILQEEYEDFYKLLYRNVNWFGSTTEQQDAAIILIGDYLVKHSISADSEINLSACMANLTKIGKQNG